MDPLSVDQVSVALGISPVQVGQRDLYITAAEVDAFRSDYRASAAPSDANVVLRIVENPTLVGGRFVSPIVAVLDLLDAADTRGATEALRILRSRPFACFG